MRFVALILPVALVACDGAVGGADDSPPAVRDATTVTFDSTNTVADTASTDTAAEVAVDTAPVSTDTAPDAPFHVCPASSAPTDCSPGSGTGMGDQCTDGPSCYLSVVQKVINNLVSTHPDWFDFTGPGGCPIIKNVDTFLDTVVADIAAKGYCAERDPNAPGEEITVKKDNGFSENFDIVSSAGCARYGAPIYTGYCAPAWW